MHHSLRPTVLCALLALTGGPLLAQTLNPPYLREMPTVDRVLKDMEVADPAETAARQMGAFLQLKKMIEDAAGRRFYSRAVGLTADENRLRQAYYNAYSQIEKSNPEYASLNALRGYDVSRQLREELFRRYFSAAFRAQVQNANAVADAHARARLDAERAASQAMLNSSGGIPPQHAIAGQPDSPAPGPSAGATAAAALVDAGEGAVASGDYDAAVTDYERAIASDPSLARAWEGLGRASYMRKQYKEANAADARCVKLQPDDAWCFVYLGLTYQRLNRYEEAADAFRRATQLRLPSANEYFEVWDELGYSLYTLQKYAEAIEPMQQAIRLKPGDDDANRYLGISYFQLGRYSDALAALARSIQAKPNDTSALYWTGRTHIQLKQYAQAVPPLREAVRLAPNDSGAWSYLGYAYFMDRRYAEAIEPLHKCVQIEPHDGDLLLLGEACLMVGRRAEAQEIYNKLAASNKEYADELANAIRLKAQADGAPAADASAKGASREIAATPAQPLSDAQIDDLVKQTGALLAARDWQGAVPLLEQLLAAKPNSWTFLSGMGDARFNLAQYDRALDAYQKGIRALDAANVAGDDVAVKNNALAHMLANEGMAFLRLKRNQEAIAAWTREAELDASAVAWFNICATQYNTGNVEGALHACDKAIAAAPGKADAWFIKGSMLVAESKTDRNGKVEAPPGTAEALKKYLELAPNGPHASDVRQMLQYIGSAVETTSRTPG